jgi:hypothetical protein
VGEARRDLGNVEPQIGALMDLMKTSAGTRTTVSEVAALELRQDTSAAH